MCGIVGVFGTIGDLRGAVDAMRECITHRGPDAAATWDDRPIALGHRRLSILDLSPTGAQPMHSPSGRYVIAFNGEIYNFQQLRRKLEQEDNAPAWRGTSDTEVLLACFDAWGIEKTLPRLNAMFAFGVWDRRERTLTLARDRFGEKPLYYGRAGQNIIFASELKALRTFPAFDDSIDLEALALYFRYAYVPAPRSIYRSVDKLPAGHFLTLREASGELPGPLPYWDPIAMAMQPREEGHSMNEWIEQLDVLLRDAVSLRMVADVPLGAFLSGGIDSTTIVALMQAQSSRPVKTFTIGNRAAGYDEAQHSREVALILGTDHTECYVTAADALAIVPQLPQMYDEPYADSSAIPTFLVSRLARQHVTVSLSGDAGDELFGGYNRHFHGPRVWSRVRHVPQPIRVAGAGAIELLSPGAWDRLASIGGRIVPRDLAAGKAGDKLHKLARSLRARNEAEFYASLVSTWPHPERLMRNGTSGDASDRGAGLSEFGERMMLTDTLQYLPDDILVKVDRASMAVSLEGRVPFLDPRVADLAWRMPMRFKVQGGCGKVVLRRLLDRYVPRELMDRPKQGFAVPIGAWLRGELRDWAEDLLSPQRLETQGFLNVEPIRQAWEGHLSGRYNHDARLWTILMFEAWIDQTKNGQPNLVTGRCHGT